MNDINGKSVMVVVRQTPYGGSLGRSALEFALAAAAFEQKVAVLFTAGGVLQLLPEQTSKAIGVRNIARLIDSFPLYDLDQLYVDESSLSAFGLSAHELPEAVQLIDTRVIRQLYHQYDHILAF